MKCFDCENEMVSKTIYVNKKLIKFNECETCGSLWIDADQLKIMSFDSMKTLVKANDVLKASGDLKSCLKCEDERLVKVHFIDDKDILLDRCDKCGGLWLDGGDLKSMSGKDGKKMPESGGDFSEFINDVYALVYQRDEAVNVHVNSDEQYVPIGGAKFIRETEFQCPACTAKLNNYKSFGVNIEGCEQCGGVWLDKDELRKLKDNATKGKWTTLRWMDDEVESVEKTNAMPSKRLCPKCETKNMIFTHFADSGIIIDWCPSCHGIWLDKNEFNAILHLLRQKLFSEESTDEMKKKVYEEIKEIWHGPEGKISEILDAKAAISALIETEIFEHPTLLKILAGISMSRVV